MSIALESGQHGGALFCRGGACYAPLPAAVVGGQGGGSSSAGRSSDSRAAVVQCEEAEEGDGEVQSSYRGPFDTMDALQDALPHRRGVSKFYNGKSSSLANAADAAFSSQPAKDLDNPENPSPKKRKGLLPFGLNKSQSKELSPVGDVTNSTSNCSKPLYPAVANSSPSKSRSDDEHECCKNLPCHCLQRRLNAMDVFASSPAVANSSPHKSRSDDEHECCKNLPCHCLERRLNAMDVFASSPVAYEPQMISVQTRSVSMVGLQDVADSTAVVSPREKRRKN